MVGTVNDSKLKNISLSAFLPKNPDKDLEQIAVELDQKKAAYTC